MRLDPTLGPTLDLFLADPLLAQLIAIRFMQSSLGCVMVGACTWAVLGLSCRRWPALASSRSTWLMAQAVTVAAFLFAMAPHGSAVSVLAPIDLTPAADVGLPAGLPAVLPAPLSAAVRAPAPVAAAPQSDAPSTRWLVASAQAWVALYLAGVAVALGRLVLAQRALRRLVRGATALDDPAAHPGFRYAQAVTVPVFETGLAVSPMLVGVWRPVLLLPRHLRDFDLNEQQMIVAHELTHLRRHDPLWMAASIAAQTALWFNPALRKLGERLTWAQEASCDRQVLAGRSQPQRKAYAAALVGQFKLQLGGVGAALAFGAAGAINPTSLAARMLLIRQGGALALGGAGRCSVIVAAAAMLAASLVLQPAFAWRLPVLPVSPPPMLARPVAVAWRVPLERPRVSSFFGVVSPLTPNGHHGIDFIARAGTPVLAAADGEVVSSVDVDAGGAKYGKTIQVAHANGLVSVYAHLDRRQVASGEVVKAGQVIGLSGATGNVTGPHLHFEVRQAGVGIDPATVLTGLDAFATPSALRSRARLAAN
jgi:murein DD-endopeptidase MepM/ murein hydrolase activator NlpD